MADKMPFQTYEQKMARLDQGTRGAGAVNSRVPLVRVEVFSDYT